MTIRILIVEDQRIVREGLRAVLEDEDEIVIVGEAANGQEAINLFAQLQPDVVLMDLQMPVLDGFTATSLIRRIESVRHVPVIAVSAQSTEEFIAAAALVGCDRFVPKPLDFDHLLEVVREFTEGAGVRAASARPNESINRQLCV